MSLYLLSFYLLYLFEIDIWCVLIPVWVCNILVKPESNSFFMLSLILSTSDCRQDGSQGQLCTLVLYETLQHHQQLQGHDDEGDQ